MGTDIHGWVEIIDDDEPEYADGIILLDSLVDRSYDIFSWLFGMRGAGSFPPLAPMRGMPWNASPQARQSFGEWNCQHSPTWITWDEILADDSTDTAEIRYVQWRESLPDGTESTSSSRIDPANWDIFDPASSNRLSAEVVVEYITRQTIIDAAAGWRLLFDLVARLAKEFGAKQLRLVVWFDS